MTPFADSHVGTSYEAFPLISVIMPCRNEVDRIAACICSLLDGKQPGGGMELIVADGRSTDGTGRLLRQLALAEPRLRVIDNPGKITPTGLNECIRAAGGQIIIRVDAHSSYASDYVVRCVETLLATGADNVGGPWISVGTTLMEEAIAAALGSSFAVGGARSHDATYEGEIDSVCFGCWRRELFDQVGLFDEELVRNQDDEHNFRIVRSGGRVWQSPRIRFTYTPRGSLTHLFRQFFQYGYWKVKVIQKHGRPASLRHLVPGAYVTVQLALGVVGLFWKIPRRIGAALACTYGIAVVASSVITAVRRKNRRLFPVLPAVFASIHISYGLGFLAGVLDFFALRRADGRHVSLTR